MNRPQALTHSIMAGLTALVFWGTGIGFSLAATDSLEYKLASINAGHYVSEDDVSVTRFRYLLNSISGKTTNTKQQIADMTVKAQQILKEDYGKEVGLLKLMEAGNKAIPDGKERVDYTTVISALVMILGR